MSIWTRIADALSALGSGEPLSQVLSRLKTPPERSIAFTIAVIALGAKIAKADGQVSRAEVSAFRRIFTIAPEDEAHAARVYNLARQDVAGYDDYARKVRRLFGPNRRVLGDLLEGLFHIATADGTYHDGENAFLAEVAAIFGFDEREFSRMRARLVPEAEQDPWEVLGVTRDTPLDKVRATWRQLVRDTHPDRLMARGVPQEAVVLAERRLQAINRAWDRINGRG